MLHQLPAVAAAAAAVTNHKVYGLLQSQTVIRSDALMNLSAVQQRLHLSLSRSLSLPLWAEQFMGSTDPLVPNYKWTPRTWQ